MLTVEDISTQLRVKENTVLGWIRAGELKAANVGRAPGKLKPRWRITPAALEAFLASRTATAVQTTRRTRRASGDAIQFYS